MKRKATKRTPRVRHHGSREAQWAALERFNAMALRMAGFLHQFKTPLHVIQSQAEMLLDDATLSPNTRRSLEMIQQNAVRLETQTRTMLEAARGKGSMGQIQPVEKLVEEICLAAAADCRQRKITLQKDILVTSPIRMDSVALEGALHNLVNNAIEAMPDGGTLRIKTFEAADLRHVGVEIQDTGGGMSREQMARLQKPFQTTKADGHGLGVYIARHIFKRHHASMRWHSEPGVGTTVTVLFPVEAA